MIMYWFTHLRWALVGACGYLSLGHMDSLVTNSGSVVGVHGLVSPGLWDLSSPTRDRTWVPCIARWILNHWATREVPEFLVKLGQHHFPNGVDPETSAIYPLTPVSVPWDTRWETLTLCKLLAQLSLWVIQKNERLIHDQVKSSTVL